MKKEIKIIITGLILLCLGITTVKLGLYWSDRDLNSKLYKVEVLGKSEKLENSKYPRVESWLFLKLESGQQIQLKVNELTYFRAQPGMTMWFNLDRRDLTGNISIWPPLTIVLGGMIIAASILYTLVVIHE